MVCVVQTWAVIRWAVVITHIARRCQPRWVLLLIKCLSDRHRAGNAEWMVHTLCTYIKHLYIYIKYNDTRINKNIYVKTLWSSHLHSFFFLISTIYVYIIYIYNFVYIYTYSASFLLDIICLCYRIFLHLLSRFVNSRFIASTFFIFTTRCMLCFFFFILYHFPLAFKLYFTFMRIAKFNAYN